MVEAWQSKWRWHGANAATLTFAAFRSLLWYRPRECIKGVHYSSFRTVVCPVNVVFSSSASSSLKFTNMRPVTVIFATLALAGSVFGQNSNTTVCAPGWIALGRSNTAVSAWIASERWSTLILRVDRISTWSPRTIVGLSQAQWVIAGATQQCHQVTRVLTSTATISEFSAW